jgi:hypothetical protein
MGLGGEVLQEQRVHRALQADMQFGDFALGQGDDPHAGKAQVLEQSRDVGLVPGDAVERLGQHDVEFPMPSIPQERPHAGPQRHARARDGGVFVAPFMPGPMFSSRQHRTIGHAFRTIGSEHRASLLCRLASQAGYQTADCLCCHK